MNEVDHGEGRAGMNGGINGGMNGGVRGSAAEAVGQGGDGLMDEVMAMQANLQELESDLKQLGCGFDE
jgi:hypothetical protein